MELAQQNLLNDLKEKFSYFFEASLTLNEVKEAWHRGNEIVDITNHLLSHDESAIVFLFGKQLYETGLRRSINSSSFLDMPIFFPLLGIWMEKFFQSKTLLLNLYIQESIFNYFRNDCNYLQTISLLKNKIGDTKELLGRNNFEVEYNRELNEMNKIMKEYPNQDSFFKLDLVDFKNNLTNLNNFNLLRLNKDSMYETLIYVFQTNYFNFIGAKEIREIESKESFKDNRIFIKTISEIIKKKSGDKDNVS